MLRIAISFAAKKIYKKDFLLLQKQLGIQYVQSAENTSQYDLLTKLLISGEDHRFRYHSGFDILAILRAVRNRLFFNKKEGASTIEQQLVRVITNNYELTFGRKLKEIFLSTTVASIVPKNSIPQIYLKVAYFGTEINGIEKAIDRVNKSGNASLSLETAAEIISRIKYPEPLRMTTKRRLQIERRKEHLIKLYQKHCTRKILKVYG